MNGDLELVSTDELVAELFRRNDQGVVGVVSFKGNGAGSFFWRHKGDPVYCHGVCGMMASHLGLLFQTSIRPLDIEDHTGEVPPPC